MDPRLVFILILVSFIALGLILFGTWIFLRFVFTEFAKTDFLFTRREEGKLKYKLKAGRLVEIITKLPRKKIIETKVEDKDGKVYRIVDDPTDSTKHESFCEWLFGVYWVGFPSYEIKEYNLVWKRPFRPDDKQAAVENPGNYLIDEKYNIVTRSDKTDYHMWKSIYSIFIRDIEIKGVKVTSGNGEIEGSVTINLFGTFTLETIDPYTPVMALNGQWFQHIEDGLKGIISDYFRKYDIDEIRQMAKASKDEQVQIRSALETAIIEFSDADGGTVFTTGLRITAFNYGGFDLGRAEIILAAEKRAIAQMTAAARIEEGRGEGQYLREIGEGEAAGFAAKILAIGNNEVAARVLSQEFKAAGMKELKGTYVEGDSDRDMLLSLPSNQQHPEPPAPVTEPAVPATAEGDKPSPTLPPAPKPVPLPIPQPPQRGERRNRRRNRQK